MSERALVAMSGGVDSSVAALLMREAGFACLGVTLRLYHNEDIGRAPGRSCCTLEDAEDARMAAFRLGIPHYVFDFSALFRQQVMEPFAAAWGRGETPNPCVECNRRIKFEALLDRARVLGCRYMATGHYARIQEKDGRYLLKKARDGEKDQSYFLYAMTQDQLAHTRFPLGELTKKEVRALAEARGLPTAQKPDSQDICFVPDGDWGAFLERWTGKKSLPGDILDPSGRAVGRHRGAERYTLGQRRGLGLAAGERVYVCGKDLERNTVTLGPESALYHRRLYAGDLKWVSGEPPAAPCRVRAKSRSRQREQEAVLYPEGETALVEFREPQRALTPGQAVVFYQGELVLGGGTIRRVE